MNNDKAVISCKSLSKSYLDAHGILPVLNSLDFSVMAGTLTGIIGVSGSGKSTLLHLLAGLDRPSSGFVFWDETDITTLSESKKCFLRNSHLGFIYQFHYLLPEFTALENVAMPLLIKGNLSIEAVREQAFLCLKEVGLARHDTHLLSELSGGERQRVAIARAIIGHPTCVLADEPTGNLDPKTAEEIFRTMLAVHDRFGTSFVFVTHDLHFAKKLPHCYTLQSGKLIPGILL